MSRAKSRRRLFYHLSRREHAQLLRAFTAPA